MKPVPLFVLPCLLSLAACAQSPAARMPAASPVPVAAVLPALDGGLTSSLLYQFLVGEIAGQRGDLSLASDAYTDLARKTRDVRVIRRAGELATYARQPTRAVEMGTLWVELEPDSARARRSLAAQMVSAGRFADAKPHLEAMLRLEDRPVAENFAQLHSVLSHAKDRMAVLDLMQELAAAYPGLPEASIAIAQAAHAAGQRSRAMQAVERALQLKPDWETAALLKGQILAEDGEEAAERYWRGYLDGNPAALRVRIVYARLLSKAGKYAEAIGEFERLRATSPENPEYAFALGLLSMQLNDLDNAEKHLVQALDYGYHDTSLVRLYLGQLDEGRQRYETALDWYRQIDPGTAQYVEAQLKSAVVLGKLSRIEEGRKLLQELRERADDVTRVVQAEAQLLREARRYPEALAVLGEALRQTPDAADLLYDHAMVAEKLDRLDLTEAGLRRLIALRPEHAHAYNALGYTLVDRTDRISEGLALLEKALKLSPDDPFILDSMGWALFKGKRYSEAVSYLKRAYALRADPEIAAHLGECLWVLGQRDEARQIWQGSLRDHPEDEYLRNTLSRFAQ